MATYQFFTTEEIETANQVNLEYFLQHRGETLLKSGREKRLDSDHSITIRGNRWYDHSKQQGGYPIDFVQSFYGLDFPMAMNALLNYNGICPAKTETPRPPKPFALPPASRDIHRLTDYLCNHRNIDPVVLQFFLERQLIYESCEGQRQFHNGIFVGLDETGRPAHGHKRNLSTDGNRFLQNVEGSNPKHSFHYLGGSNTLFVFESPIDLLSFISLNKTTPWWLDNYVALCGLSAHAMMERLERQSITQVALCLDNDKAGHLATQRLAELLAQQQLLYQSLVPKRKDFNDDLLLHREEVPT